jgi:hypothetical protein
MVWYSVLRYRIFNTCYYVELCQKDEDVKIFECERRRRQRENNEEQVGTV